MTLDNINLDEFIGDSTCVDDEEKSPETIPAVGSSTLTITEKCESLLISCVYTLVASVDQYVLERSPDMDRQHRIDEISSWARDVILRHQHRLRRLGVDVRSELVARGGCIDQI